MACLPVLFPRTASAEEIPQDLPIVVDVDAAADAAEGIDDEVVEKAIAKPKPKKSKLQSKKSVKPKKTTKNAPKSKLKKPAQTTKDTKKSKPKVASTKKDGAAPKRVASSTKKSKPLALSKPSKVADTKDDSAAVDNEPKPAKKLNKKPRRPLKRRQKQS